MKYAQRLGAIGLLLASPFATGMPLNGRDSQPTVTVKNGSYSGLHSAEYDQDFFLGVPYAKTPERFTVAEGLDSTFNETRVADTYPRHCVGYGGDMIGYEVSEDCLYLNVVRPAGISEDANLPVAFWIHGGGLFMGGSADRRYNMSFMVEQSVEMGTPIIGVSINYRMSAFGFLTGQEAEDAGATNIGFRDQRLALRWVNENIAAFGGSPDKVTIFGESSGAESVTAQVLAYNGDHDGLFRGAIGQSGFGSALLRHIGGYNATEERQKSFDDLVKGVSSCASTVGSAEALECIREAPFAEVNAALNGTNPAGPWAPVLDGDFIVDFSANQFAQGNFAQVPLLIGANTDEGSGFGSIRGPGGGGNLNSDADMTRAVRSVLSPFAEENTGKSLDQYVDEALYVYPDIQALGIPSLETWPVVIQPNDSFAESLGLQVRRGNAFFGDIMMQYLRRRSNQIWSELDIPSYAYRFDVTPNPLPQMAGSVHFQEVAFVFYNLNGDGYAENPFGGNDTEYIANAQAVAKSMCRAWINFFVEQDPNGDGLFEESEAWPVFDLADGGGVGREIVFAIDKTFVEMDNFRAEGINWLIENDLTLFGN